MHGHGVTHVDKRPAAVDLSKGRRRAVLAVVSLALALVMGMAVSLSVALPDLARDIGATQAQLQWIVNAYAVVFAGLLLPAGAWGIGTVARGCCLAGWSFSGRPPSGAPPVWGRRWSCPCRSRPGRGGCVRSSARGRGGYGPGVPRPGRSP